MSNRPGAIAKIAEHYGIEHQKHKAIEELSELTRALARGDRENIVEELADVEIMLQQITYLMDIRPHEVNDVATRKIDRQLKRMERENGRINKSRA